MTVQTHSVLNLVHMNASNTTNTAVVLRRRRDKSGDYWVLAFRYNKARIAAARAGGGKWHAMLGAWLFPTSAYSYASVKQLFGPETAWDDHTSIADRLPTLMKTGESSLIAFERWLVQKRYSKSTQATYIEAARLFFALLAASRQNGVESAYIGRHQCLQPRLHCCQRVFALVPEPGGECLEALFQDCRRTSALAGCD